MPYVFDQTDVEWDDEDAEPPPPAASRFQYLAPPDFGGAAAPVSFSLPSPDAENGAPAPSAAGGLTAVFSRILGGTPKPHDPQAQARRQQMMFTRLVTALRAMGAKQVYCRYDGGNDEGFAWVEWINLAAGGRLDAAELSARLSASGVLRQFDINDVLYGASTMSGTQQKRYIVEQWLANEWATLLLGRGYGTGEYAMYGAFTVDLDALTITDDPKADPEVKNITLADG
jgi:hypothetical protein